MSRKSELESKIRDLESQISDIKSRISDQEYKNDGYREQLRDIETQIKDYHERNYNEWISNQNEWRNDLGEYFEERGEYWDNRQQIRFYDKELSEVPRNNLKEGERIVKDYRRELSDLYSELHHYEDELGRAHSEEDDGYSYEGNSSDDDDDDDDDDDGYDEEDDYEDDYVSRPTPPPAKEAPKIVIRVEKQDAYTSRRKALQDYAKRQNKPYKELPSVKGGYRALVGDTSYDYRNVDDLVISNSKGIPTLDDFKAILQEERRMGRNIMPLGEISSLEYKARLVLACDEVGIKPIGNIRIPKQDYGKLGLFTKIKYQKFIDKLDKSLAASRAALAAAQKKKTR